MAIAAETRLRPCRDVAARQIDDGAILVNMASGKCFELNRVGFDIWGALGDGNTVRGVCEALAGRYRVENEVLAADVQLLVQTLAEAGLIEPASTSGSP